MKKVSRVLAQVSIVFLVAASSMLAGCVKQRPMDNNQGQESTTTQPEVVQHTIKYQGETYALIARWYTGDARNWKVIADANPAIKPTRMRLGDVIVIPRSLVKQEKPLPKDFVSKSVAATPAPAESTSVSPVAVEPASVEQVEQPVENPSEIVPAKPQVPVEVQQLPKPAVTPVPQPQQAIQKSPLLEDEDIGEKKNKQQTAPTAKPVDAIGPSQTIGQPNSEEDANKAKLLNELLD